MTENQNETRNVFIKFRVNLTERYILKQLAEESCLSISDFIRIRLFDEAAFIHEQLSKPQQIDSKARFACDHDKELMRFICRAYLYSKEMAKKELGQEWFDEAEQVAKLLLKDWGYE